MWQKSQAKSSDTDILGIRKNTIYIIKSDFVAKLDKNYKNGEICCTTINSLTKNIVIKIAI